MKRKTLIWMFAIIALTVLGITSWSYVSLRNNAANGFTRNVKDHLLTSLFQAHQSRVLTGISGFTDNHYYFSTNDPQVIFISKSDLSDTQSYTIRYDPDKRISESFNVWVDSPEIKIYAGNIPCVLSASLKNKAVKLDTLDGTIFNKIIPCSDKTYIMKRHDSALRDFQFRKTDLAGNDLVSEHGVSVIQHDDGISTDGTLLFDKTGSRVIYLYKLFNQFVCMDTDLMLRYTARTIDTVNYHAVPIGTYNKNGMVIRTFSRAPKLVNLKACISNNNLFVCSGIKADNETTGNFRDNAVIDIYDLNNGAYRYSFYIPKGTNKRLTSFKVIGDRVLAVFDKGKNIVVYQTQTIL
ncbi:MAG TPA: hypothetical protein VHA52_12425 [Candidatus Babeliaceae bacterium]|nr:hypothetical protein [Candidatus Babeliaceae bacterium]